MAGSCPEISRSARATSRSRLMPGKTTTADFIYGFAAPPSRRSFTELKPPLDLIKAHLAPHQDCVDVLHILLHRKHMGPQCVKGAIRLALPFFQGRNIQLNLLEHFVHRLGCDLGHIERLIQPSHHSSRSTYWRGACLLPA